ncbi:MarR family transcriptional regulator [Aliiroseovarius sp. KMU-50]|uniref:MarR family transcriptional regulator n=1 Tax=Aliiroseovarius salicola TaxID=3009082 RepID=A0ABT4W2W9_9RHOB|nr:MarR family transcriptional regulator [Aliiroseovarius sp. KMU-50]MDA5094330.1 MarR family transcriptional regulator [Aliiroseovarius sp. KMU-50]
MSQIAVLTGDIVNSTQLSPEQLDQALEALKQATDEISAWHANSTQTTTIFGRRGGDGWQAMLQASELSLRAALFLRASLMSAGPFQTRIAAASGSGTLNKKAQSDPNYAHGSAFTQSGRLLDQLPRNRLMQHAQGGTLSASFLLADHISREWTQAQAMAMSLALAPSRGTQQDMADKLQISRQAVAQALRAAGYTAIHGAIELIETELRETSQDA